MLMYFEDDKAALWPILDEVFATKPTAEWCELLGHASLSFAPVRDHAEVAADAGVRANGYIAHVVDPDAPGSPPRWQSAGALLGTDAGGPSPGTRAGREHRRGPARGGELLGRHRQPVGRGCDLGTPSPVERWTGEAHEWCKHGGPLGWLPRGALRSGDFEVLAIFVEVKGLEPSTYGLQSRRSSS